MQEKLRKAAKMLSEYGFSLREACKEAKVARPTVKKWLAKQQRKEAEKFYKLPKPELAPPKRYRVREIKQFIDERRGNVFIKDIREHLQLRGLGTMSEQRIGYWIRHYLGYTYKKATTTSPDINKVEFVQHQAHVAERLKDAINFGLYIIYIDETAFTRNEGKVYGFAPKGERLSFQAHKPAYSIGGIAATSAFRLEAFQLRDGKTNKHAFFHFVLSLLSKLRAEGFPHYDRIVFYLDNATYHTCPDSVRLFRLLDIHYIFAPAYASPLNPIEQFFGVVKKKLRHYNIINK